MRAAIALAIMFGWLTSAKAGNDIGIVVTGEGILRPQLSAYVATWLIEHGRIVVGAALPSAAVSKLIDCMAVDRADCAREVIDTQARPSTVVYLRGQQDDAKRETRDFTLVAYWFAKGQAGIVEREPCEPCVGASLGDATDRVMTRLTRAVGRSMGHIAIRSPRPGARITIDGTPAGITPLDRDVSVGEHTVAIERDKHEPQKRTITVRAGQSEVVDMSLVDVRSGERDPSTRSAFWRALPVTAMSTGAAAVIVGGVLIAIDQEKDERAPRTVHNSAPAGVGISIAGVAVAAIGTYLWLRRPEPTSSPVAAVTSDTAYVGWLGRF